MHTVSVSKTKENTIYYPLHHHSEWEIMYYLEGAGYLATATQPIPFRPGSMILVPPGTVHGSVSEHGFVNISVGGDFSHLFLMDRPVCLQDTAAGDGRALAELIYRNRSEGGEYLWSLCTAYVYFLLQSVGCTDPIRRQVTDLVALITNEFADPGFNLSRCLEQSGYTRDYLRMVFRQMTGMTPLAFLTKTRIDHACKLLEIYGHSIAVSEVAAACGFEDAAYFSKRFKQQTGCSPDRYRSCLLHGPSKEF